MRLSEPAPRPVPGIVFRLTAVVVLLIGGFAAWIASADPRAGGATAAAHPPAQEQGRSGGCAGRDLIATRELRGMWLTTVGNRDWPSRPGLPIEQVKAEYRAWLDVAAKMNHNAIFVHVRPSGDAFWPSEYVPWSHWLTGREDGSDPGWDPMEFLVAEAHARNLEFHAWFNPYKASQKGTVAELPPNHPLRKHPEWAVAYPSSGSGRRLYYDPGIPAARVYVEDSILEAVAKYDIDAIHFDDFFYPYPVNGEDFPDDKSYATYGAGSRSKADWRRQNVNLFVKEMSQRIKSLKPWVKFGISPFGIWRNQSSDPAGSATRGLESYSAISADTRTWVKQGWLDYVVPQLYWHIGFDVADYAVLLPWWANLVRGTQVHLYIGQADYRVGESGAWSDPAELDRQLALNDKYGAQGSVHFSARHVRADPRGAVSRYRKAHYATPALVPVMSHLPAQRPDPPVGVRVHDDGVTATVTWLPPASGPAPTSYAIYRADAPNRPAELVGTVRAQGSGPASWTDPAGPGYAYCVTALDRLWNESRPA